MRFLLKKYAILLMAIGGLVYSCDDDSLTIPRIKISLTATPASSFGAQDGSIQAVVEGGSPPYSYFWSNGTQDPNVSGLPSGEYTLKVVDSESAVASKTIVIEQPDATPLGFQFAVKDVSWFGGDDGEVTLTVTGGTPPYTFLWEDGEDKPNLGNLFSGIYTVTVMDSGTPSIVTIDSIEIKQPEFVCGRDSITDVDGNKYPTVKIGAECWTADNLRTTHLPNNPVEDILGHFCQGTNCNNALGAHYTWDAMMNGAESPEEGTNVQGICPCEWHIPSKKEWELLTSWLSIDGNGGNGNNVPNKIRGAESPSGFNALNAGNWGYAAFEGENAVFWTATEQSEDKAIYRILNNFPLLGQGNLDKRSGLSVRCVKD